MLILLLSFSNVLAQWTPQVSGTSKNLYSMDFINHNTGFCVGSEGVILKTTNGGINWATLPCSIVANFNYVKMFGYNNIIISVNDTNILLKSTNSGNNWSSYSLPNIPKETQFVNFTNGFYLPNTHGYTGAIYNTTDGGQSWISRPLNFGGAYSFFKDIHFSNETTGWICYTVYFELFWVKYVYVQKTTNAGITWNSLYSKSTNTSIIMTYKIFFVNSNLGFLTEYPYTACLYRTTNGGNNFQHNPSAGSYKIYYSMSFPSIDTGWFTGDKTIKTIDGGVNWDTITTPGGNSYKTVFFINNLTGWIAGDGGLIAKTTTGATNIKGISNKIHKSFELYQNYPNPFNPITRIRFELSKSSHIKLVIYDALGKEIVKLVNEKLNTGSYEKDWNGNNSPSGVYFYKIETDKYSEVKKMVLLK